MEALLHSESRIYVFQNIYNARTPYCISLPSLKVKLIHGRHDNYEKIRLELNSKIKNRVWIPKNQVVLFKKKTFLSIIEKFIFFFFKSKSK